MVVVRHASRLMSSPQRYHLVFGAPSCGKSTVAQCLVERLQARGQRAQLLTPVFDLLFDHDDRSTANVLRREDEWVFHLDALVEAAGRDLEQPEPISWVFEATACTPQIRMQYPLQLQQSGPIEWIGWCLQTPDATCQHWNAGRPLPMRWQEGVITELAALLGNADLRPSIEDGFACLVDLTHSQISGGSGNKTLRKAIDAALNRLDGRCAELAGERDELQLHAYSCPADFERLMYGLVQAIWDRPHTYANQWLLPIDGSGFALAADREFCRESGLWPAHDGQDGSEPPTILASPARQSSVNHRGGWHPLSDAQVFQAVMEELRRFLHGATIPAQHSEELEDILDRYGLTRVVQPLTIQGKALQDLKALIRSRPIETCRLVEPEGNGPTDLHLLFNPYGEAIRIRTGDGRELEADRCCYLALAARSVPKDESTPILIFPKDPRSPQIPMPNKQQFQATLEESICAKSAAAQKTTGFTAARDEGISL